MPVDDLELGIQVANRAPVPDDVAVNSLRTLPSLLLVGTLMAGLAACGDDGPDAVSAADLDGRSFVATELTGGTIVDGSEIVIEFRDGGVAVNAGCNTQRGGYEISDDTLVVGPMASTMMACPDELMAQDTLLTGLLESGPVIALDGTELTLRSDEVTLTLVER